MADAIGTTTRDTVSETGFQVTGRVIDRDSIPAYRSSVFTIVPSVRKADRDNTLWEDITSSVSAIGVEHDIDRAGPKSQVSLTLTDARVAGTGDWVAPFVEIVPEIGDVVSAQRGLYQLDDPTVTFSGVGTATSQASGTDMVRIYERTVLQAAQITPTNARMDAELRFALEAATTGRWGADLVVNGSFEEGDAVSATGWTFSSYNGAVTPADSRSATVVAHRGHSYSIGMDASSPMNAGVYAYSTAFITVPAGRPLMLLEGFIAPGTGILNAWFHVEEWDATTHLGNSGPSNVVTLASAGDYDVWERSWRVFRPRANATRLRVTFHAQLVVTGLTGAKAMRFDKVTLRTIATAPVTRFSLPAISSVSSSAISHNAGATWLQRINDLTAAVAHHALLSMPDGSVTTRPQRDPRTDTPKRVYTIGEDARIVGDISTTRSVTGFRNVVVAIKEDYETGTAMVAVARNDNPAHPWSTVNYGEVAGMPITVSDAVDQTALQAIANAELAKASMQESITLSVLPDPELTLHDVIEIRRSSGWTALEDGYWLRIADGYITKGTLAEDGTYVRPGFYETWVEIGNGYWLRESDGYIMRGILAEDGTYVRPDFYGDPTPPPEEGRWAIEKIREGLTSAEPLMAIEARRILTTAHPEGV